MSDGSGGSAEASAPGRERHRHLANVRAERPVPKDTSKDPDVRTLVLAGPKGFPLRHARGLMSCLFCKIAAREIPSEKVGENDGAFAFLDIQPLRRGHVLVVPKQHAERFADMPPETARAVMDLAQEMVARQTKRLGAEGVTIAVNDGRAAGQEVLHVHVHLVPREATDGHGPIHWLFRDAKTKLKEGELQEIRSKMTG